MTISIQCSHCHKRYNAPATMAGKKVKCKHCGQVFAIPINTAALPEAGAGSTVQNEGAGAVAKPVGNGAPSESRTPAASGKLGHPGAGFSGKVARREGTQELDLADGAGPAVMLRPSLPMDFPGADSLDRLAPLFLIVVGLGWLSLVAFTANNTLQGWVGIVRFVAFMALCAGVVFPLGYWAIRSAARKHRFMLPPTPGLRAFASFALAFTVPIAFWQMSGSTTLLVFGSVLGVVLACSAVWFLFRVQSPEMSSAMGATAGAFALSVAIAYFALFGIDQAFRAAAKRSGTNQLASSPMGAIAWDVPIGTAPEVKPHKPKIAFNPIDSSPETQPSNVNVGTSQPTTSNIIVDMTKPPVVAVAPEKTTAPTETLPPREETHPPVEPEHTPVVTTRPKTTVAAGHEVDVTIPTSPLVAKTTVIGDLEPDAKVVFASGVGNVAAAISANATEEHVQFFSGNPLVKKGETTFEVEAGVQQQCFLSGNGDTLARMISFPKLAVQLWNTYTNKEMKVVPLDASHGTPELLGFGANDSLVVLWNKRNLPDVEVINAKAQPPQNVAYLKLKAFELSPCNPTISAEGRQMAVGAFLEEKGGLYLWDLTSTRSGAIKTCAIPLSTWSPPTGIAYGPMGATVAVYFEVNNKGVLYNYRTSDASLLHEHAYRTLPYPVGSALTFTGHTLDYVDANTWLLLGRALLDTETGKSLGDLQIENPLAQRVLDKETILLQAQNPNGKNQLLQVKLKGDALLARRNEVRGIKVEHRGQ